MITAHEDVLTLGASLNFTVEESEAAHQVNEQLPTQDVNNGTCLSFPSLSEVQLMSQTAANAQTHFPLIY